MGYEFCVMGLDLYKLSSLAMNAELRTHNALRSALNAERYYSLVFLTNSCYSNLIWKILYIHLMTII